LAIHGLVRIYEQEKEWQKAIDVMKLLKRSEREGKNKQVAHYYCELAEQSMSIGDFQIARQYLRNARNEHSSIARSLLLRGDLRRAEGDHAGARELWLTLAQLHSNFAELIVARMVKSFSESGEHDELKNYLLGSCGVPKDANSFSVWKKAIEEQLGESDTLVHILEKSQNEVMSATLAEYLCDALNREVLSDKLRIELLIKMLGRAKNQKIEYTCVSCGFNTKAMYWFCPNCGQWESFR